MAKSAWNNLADYSMGEPGGRKIGQLMTLRIWEAVFILEKTLRENDS
jgi:hypothetical protein